MLLVIDYGIGNLQSVLNAVVHVGAHPTVTDSPSVVAQGTKIILPGVGSFRRGMKNISRLGLDEALREAVVERKVPLLGICLGMQLLGLRSNEDGITHGLALLPFEVERINASAQGVKVPHVGFNTVAIERRRRIFEGLGAKADFYFTHSYWIHRRDEAFVAGTSWHGETFVSAVEQNNIAGVQFHPEKSQANGIAVIRNFVDKF